MGISSEQFLNELFKGFTPVIQDFIIPILLWILIPAIIFTILLDRRYGWRIGGFLGFIALFTIGPFSN